MTRELVLWLLEQGHQPVHLHPRPQPGTDLVSLSLKEAIALREQGKPATCLQFLQKLQHAGLESPWISDNAARALIDLQQLPQAVVIWQRLIRHADEDVVRVASDTLQAVLQPLLNELHGLCGVHAWSARHLPGVESAPEDDLLLAILNEAIAARESHRIELSIALLNAARSHGWNSPWLQDNQARALVHQGYRDDACAIWAELQHHEDGAVAAEAIRMLETYQPSRISHPLREQIEALERAGQHEQAGQLLLEGLATAPDDATLWTLLEQRQPAPSPESHGLLDQELAAVNRRLSAEEALLAYLESRLATPPA